MVHVPRIGSWVGRRAKDVARWLLRGLLRIMGGRLRLGKRLLVLVLLLRVLLLLPPLRGLRLLLLLLLPLRGLRLLLLRGQCLLLLLNRCRLLFRMLQQKRIGVGRLRRSRIGNMVGENAPLRMAPTGCHSMEECQQGGQRQTALQEQNARRQARDRSPQRTWGARLVDFRTSVGAGSG